MTSHSLKPPQFAHASYRPDVDGLRAIAVLAVVGFHAFPKWVKGGFVGVDVFFVISGYLITTLLLLNLEQKSFSFVRFYIRRINRLFPALLLVLTASLAAGWFLLLPFEYKLFGKQIAAAAAYVSNFLLWSEAGYFDLDSEVKPLLHLWSLGIEEQFYLVWPLFLAFAWRRKWNLFIAIGAVAALSLAADLLLIERNAVAAFFSPATRFWELLLGGLLAWAERRPAGLLRGYENLRAAAGLVLVATGIVLIDRTRAFPDWTAILPCLGTFLVISAGSGAWLNRQVLSLRPLVWIGLISYPLYLWHWPLLSFARILNSTTPSVATRVALCLIALPLAGLTYILVERPIRFGPHGGRKALTLLALVLGVGALGAGVYVANGIPSRSVIGQKRPAVVRENNELTAPPCTESDHLPAALAQACIGHVNAGARPRVILWGDSHIGVWGPVLERIARARGFELFVLRHEGCPPIAGVRRSDIKESLAICGTLDVMNAIQNGVLKLKPDIVILTARWSLYTHGWIRNGKLLPANSCLTADPTGVATPATSKRALEKEIPASIGRLRQHGIRVVVFKNPPVLNWEITNVRKSIDEVQVTAAEHAAYSKLTDDIFASLRDVTIFDPARELCRNTCAVERNGKSLYFDDNHLSASAAAAYEPEIGALLDRQLMQVKVPHP